MAKKNYFRNLKIYIDSLPLNYKRMITKNTKKWCLKNHSSKNFHLIEKDLGSPTKAAQLNLGNMICMCECKEQFVQIAQ